VLTASSLGAQPLGWPQTAGRTHPYLRWLARGAFKSSTHVPAFPKCTDATRFAGVRFKIRGNYAGFSMEHATKDVQHEDRARRAKFSTGKRGACPPQSRLQPSQVTHVAQAVTVPFGGQGIRGNPALPLDKPEITGLVWQFSVGMASDIVDGTTTCVADLAIDDITFHP